MAAGWMSGHVPSVPSAHLLELVLSSSTKKARIPVVSHALQRHSAIASTSQNGIASECTNGHVLVHMDNRSAIKIGSFCLVLLRLGYILYILEGTRLPTTPQQRNRTTVRCRGFYYSSAVTMYESHCTLVVRVHVIQHARWMFICCRYLGTLPYIPRYE